MSEQTVNIMSKMSQLSVIIRTLKLVFVTLLTISLSACLPSGEQNINTELFKDKQDMASKEQTLKRGMRKNEVFSALGIESGRFQRMNMQEMQNTVYGQSVVQGTPEQLEAFRRLMERYEGYSLPYREIKASSSLGFGTMRIQKTGYDLRIVLIFEDGRLCKSAIEGTQEVNQSDDQSMWNTLLMKGIGTAF